MRLNITIPVFNEEKILNENIRKIFLFCQSNIQDNFKIVIVNNGSTDNTENVAKKICKENKEIKYLFIKKKGRGKAIKTSWLKINADIYSYMDIDLSTGLSAIQETVLNMEKGYDMVIGSRYQTGSKVKRNIYRSILSKGYNILVQLLFRTKVKDMQCGFKAINQRIIKQVLPKIKDNGWFFDTEMVLIAERENYRIKEIPIKWTDNPNTKVNILKTVINYLVNLTKLKVRMKDETQKRF